MAAEIRLATADDVQALAETHVASWQVAYAGQLPQELLDGLDANDRVPGWIQALSQPPPTAVYVAGGVSTADDGSSASNESPANDRSPGEDRQVAAFAAVGAASDDDLDSDTVGEVMAIYAHPDCWGTGIGRQLMIHSIEHLVSAGFEEAILWVLASNERAIQFYENGGWTADQSSHGTKQDTIGGAPVEEVRYRITLDRADPGRQ